MEVEEAQATTPCITMLSSFFLSRASNVDGRLCRGEAGEGRLAGGFPI